MKKNITFLALQLMALFFIAGTSVAAAQSSASSLDQTDLRISDGSQFEPQKFFPKFSWDTTPLYYMFGDKNKVLRPKQVKFIAERTNFLCIEKSHGMKPLGDAVLGAKHEAAAFRRFNPDVKVLFYFNSAFAWPYTSYNEDFTKERIDGNPKLKKFLIANPKTGKLAEHYGAFCFDLLNPDFRDWWVKTVAKGVKQSAAMASLLTKCTAM